VHARRAVKWKQRRERNLGVGSNPYRGFIAGVVGINDLLMIIWGGYCII